ncbi:hypothetical protein [Spirosoma harenae]
MSILRVLQLFAFLVVTGFMLEAVYWLLNQRSDTLPMIAGLVLLVYLWLTVRSKFFTKNPFTNHHHE